MVVAVVAVFISLEHLEQVELVVVVQQVLQD
jgi:hypothetical protein